MSPVDGGGRATSLSQGIIEKNVQDARRRIWLDAKTQRFATFDALNAWLANRCRALWAEIRQRANPGCLDYMPVSEAIEDHACMSLSVAEKLAESLQRARYLIAIELIIAAQAVDLRGTDRAQLGHGARQAYDKVRALVSMLDEDRSMGPDIELICSAVADGAFSQLQTGSVSSIP